MEIIDISREKLKGYGFEDDLKGIEGKVIPISTLSNCDKAYKIYFPFAYPYVFDNYLDNYIFNYDIEEKITNLYNLRDKIKNTDLPLGLVKCENHPIGCIIKFYQNSICIDDLYHKYEIDSIVNYFLQINDNLKEMTNYCIYDLDAYDKNIVIHNNKAKLIDIDGLFMRIENSWNKKLYEEVFKKLNYTILQYIFYLSNSKNYIIDNKEIEIINKIEDPYYKNIELLNNLSQYKKIRILK